MKRIPEIFSQQAQIMLNPVLRAAFEELLQGIAGLNAVPKPAYRCYLSYAWPIEPNLDRELLVQPFLLTLFQHLKLAGLSPILDLLSYRDSDNIYSFSAMANNTDFVILFGTPSLRTKHEDPYWSPEKVVMANAMVKQHRDLLTLQRRVIPINLVGSVEESFLSNFQLHEVLDWGEGDYFRQLQILLGQIFFQGNPTSEYKQLWAEFHQRCMPQHASQNTLAQPEEVSHFFTDCFNQICSEDRVSYLQSERKRDSIRRKILQKERHGLPLTHEAFNGCFQLPSVSHFFAGRHPELVHLDTMLCDFPRQAVRGVCVTGSPGIGKSQLIAMYLRMMTENNVAFEGRQYDSVVWMRAGSEDPEDTPKLLRRQFLKLAASLEMDTVRVETDQAVYQYVFEKLAERGSCLLVFDNVHALLPLQPFMPTCTEKFTVLMTSRNSLASTWSEQFDLLPLEPFTQNAAISFISDFLEYKKPSSQFKLEDVTALASACGCYPLFLAQALAYIINNNKDIQAYLTYLDKYQDRIFATKLFANDPYKLEKNNQYELYQAIKATLHAVIHSIFSKVSESSKPLLALCVSIPDIEVFNLALLQQATKSDEFNLACSELLQLGLLSSMQNRGELYLNRVVKIVTTQVFIEQQQQHILQNCQPAVVRYTHLVSVALQSGSIAAQTGFYANNRLRATGDADQMSHGFQSNPH